MYTIRYIHFLHEEKVCTFPSVCVQLIPRMIRVSNTEWLKIPNLISLSRIVLAAPVLYLLYLQHYETSYLTFWLLIVLAFTDFLDGYMSRLLKQESQLGIMLDPLADKISMAAVLIGLVAFTSFPKTLMILLIYRDLVILLGGIAIMRRVQEPIKPNFLGKLNTAVIFVTVLMFVLHLPSSVVFPAIGVSCVMTLISGIAYFIRGENMLALREPTRSIGRGLAILLTLIVLFISLHFDGYVQIPFFSSNFFSSMG